MQPTREIQLINGREGARFPIKKNNYEELDISEFDDKTQDSKKSEEQLAEQRKKELITQKKINTPTVLEAGEQVRADQRQMEQVNEGHNNYGE